LSQTPTKQLVFRKNIEDLEQLAPKQEPPNAKLPPKPSKPLASIIKNEGKATI
jgi:hypothetical protein